MSVQAITSSGELTTLLQETDADKLIVIDFHATWCGPCLTIAPKILAMAGEYEGVVFLKVDVDECGGIAGDYGIQCMPTFKFIKNSVVLETTEGANEAKLRELISKHT